MILDCNHKCDTCKVKFKCYTEVQDLDAQKEITIRTYVKCAVCGSRIDVEGAHSCPICNKKICGNCSDAIFIESRRVLEACMYPCKKCTASIEGKTRAALEHLGWRMVYSKEQY